MSTPEPKEPRVTSVPAPMEYLVEGRKLMLANAAKYQPLPEWESMTPRQRDAAVAEHVCGWRWIKKSKDASRAELYSPEDARNLCNWLTTAIVDERSYDHSDYINPDFLPRYTTDANADLSVL